MPIPTSQQYVYQGMSVLPSLDILKQLPANNIKIHTMSEFNASIKGSVIPSRIRWFASNDRINWKVYNGTIWFDVTTQSVENGMTYSVMNELNTNIIRSLLDGKNTLYLKAVMLSSMQGEMPKISNVVGHFPSRKFTGDYIIKHGESSALDTNTWTKVKKCLIVYDEPENTNIKLAFKAGSILSPWMAWNGLKWAELPNENSIFSMGMTVKSVQSLSSDIWSKLLTSKLFVMIGLRNNNRFTSPSITSIKFDYVGIENPDLSNTITIYTPSRDHHIKRYSLQKYIYENFLFEGFGFAEPGTDDNFYTTPNRIILRPLDAGTLIGGKASNCYPFEVISTWMDITHEVLLRIRHGAYYAKAFENFCLLDDAALDKNKTKIEMAYSVVQKTDNEGNVYLDLVDPEYPLNFVLGPNSKKLVYLRISPNVVGMGQQKFDVMLKAISLL